MFFSPTGWYPFLFLSLYYLLILYNSFKHYCYFHSDSHLVFFSILTL